MTQGHELTLHGLKNSTVQEPALPEGLIKNLYFLTKLGTRLSGSDEIYALAGTTGYRHPLIVGVFFLHFWNPLVELYNISKIVLIFFARHFCNFCSFF